MAGESTPSRPLLRSGPRRLRRHLLVAGMVALSIAAVLVCARVLIESRVLRAPYPEAEKQLGVVVAFTPVAEQGIAVDEHFHDFVIEDIERAEGVVLDRLP